MAFKGGEIDCNAIKLERGIMEQEGLNQLGNGREYGKGVLSLKAFKKSYVETYYHKIFLEYTHTHTYTELTYNWTTMPLLDTTG